MGAKAPKMCIRSFDHGSNATKAPSPTTELPLLPEDVPKGPGAPGAWGIARRRLGQYRQPTATRPQALTRSSKMHQGDTLKGVGSFR